MYIVTFVFSCNPRYVGPACLSASLLRELREDFSEYPLSSTLWSSVTGNNRNLNSRCGRLTGTYVNQKLMVHLCEYCISLQDFTHYHSVEHLSENLLPLILIQ